MFFNQYDNEYRCRAQQMNSYIRVLHASPNAPAVDIYANDELIVSDLAYMETTEYLPVPPDTYNIKVFATGQMTNPVIDTEIDIPADSIFTVAAIGELPDISLFPIPEPNSVPNSGNACVRFVHLSPDAPAVDIVLTDGTDIFLDVEYMDITNYECVSPGTYSFDVIPSGTENVVLSIPAIQLDPDTAYTIYAVGLVENSPALEVLLIPETR